MNAECQCGRPTRDAAYGCDNCGDLLARALGNGICGRVSSTKRETINEAARCVNTKRPLTRSTSTRPKEGLAMKATQVDPELWNRFWEKVNKTDTCWLWTGAKNGHGYGNFRLPGRNRGAHRVAYTWLVGEVDSELHLDHLCRVRHCVNPAHLEPVTVAVNLLRGVGPTGTKARQTHCVHGHEFTPENTIVKKNGCRGCRSCSSRRSSEKWQRRKAAAKEASK